MSAPAPKIYSTGFPSFALADHEIVMDPETLRRLGWKSVVARTVIPDAELDALLSELKRSKDSHTWHWLKVQPGSSCVEQMHSFENVRRPTVVYFYQALTNDGRKVLIGSGAIAGKINHSFKYDGFPVIARCYILEQFRNNRIYFNLLSHRLSVCQKIWGKSLNAVHLGTSNIRVFHSIKKNYFGLPFVYVGNELLEGVHDGVKVRDYLWLSDQWKERLLGSTKDLVRRVDSRQSRELLECVKALVENHFLATSYAKLSAAYNEADQQAQLSSFAGFPLTQLMALLRAIPVLEESHDELLEDVVLYKRRAG